MFDDDGYGELEKGNAKQAGFFSFSILTIFSINIFYDETENFVNTIRASF